MDRTFEEVTEEIENYLGETIGWFKETYPADKIQIDAEYDAATRAYRWGVMICKKPGNLWKGFGAMYSQKMHSTGWLTREERAKLVPRYQKLIKETMEAPWEEPIS